MKSLDYGLLDDVVSEVVGLPAGEREVAYLPKSWRRKVSDAVVRLV